jgi:multisubunit Na+/H+ antiporter MnhE subunit
MNRAALWIVLSMLVYAFTLASFDALDLLLGALVAAGLLTMLRTFLFGGRPTPIARLGRRAAAAPRFAWAVVRDMTIGTWNVAAVVLGARPLDRPGIVVVPFGERSPNGVVVTAFVATLSPGEFLVDIDWSRRRLLFHVLDARSPDAVRARFSDFYDRYQRAIAP